MQEDRGGEALLKWVGIAAPGFRPESLDGDRGMAAVCRILWGVAASSIYALIDLAIKAATGKRD